ncbi:hypothetical protein BIFANG_02040 [Bifidobacterium angulatum DSM 20098 = JCM 7096]|uniref:Uncharacterized protein n=1 Tax=Bifidobacterium angulatum DSM 20098 = JCM 7096 TaxID=518635 RepID=C4FCL4_9BIFI|nr:hypothetical protein BIFANG_02040 [Bifidobacterium angulatum DSM 20098 = JCM 7096]
MNYRGGERLIHTLQMPPTEGNEGESAIGWILPENGRGNGQQGEDDKRAGRGRNMAGGGAYAGIY